MNTIGERIVFLRECLDLSQKELATKIGITNTTLYKYEKNICEPRSEIILRLANELQTTADFLIGRTNRREPICISDEIETLSIRDNQLLSNFHKLTNENQARIIERIITLLETQ